MLQLQFSLLLHSLFQLLVGVSKGNCSFIVLGESETVWKQFTNYIHESNMKQSFTTVWSEYTTTDLGVCLEPLKLLHNSSF